MRGEAMHNGPMGPSPSKDQPFRDYRLHWSGKP